LALAARECQTCPACPAREPGGPLGPHQAHQGGADRTGRRWAQARTPQFRPPARGRLEEKMQTMKVQPLHDRILVKRVEEEQKTKGGIIIPDTAKEKPQEGKVIAVGKGRILDDGKVQELAVKKGDKILFSKYAGTEIQLDGEEHIIIREDDVLAILE
jgi:chaperonin GroES